MNKEEYESGIWYQFQGGGRRIEDPSTYQPGEDQEAQDNSKLVATVSDEQ